MSRDLPSPEDVSLERIANYLGKLVEIAEQKKAIVPIFVFIPSENLHEDQLVKLAKAFRYEMERNGLIEPEAPDLHDV